MTYELRVSLPPLPGGVRRYFLVNDLSECPANRLKMYIQLKRNTNCLDVSIR